MALAYPNTYHVGMSSLGFQEVFRLANSNEDVACERIFTDRWTDVPRSVESGRPVSDFDILAFSLAFENDYPGLLALLRQGGVPLLSRERDASHPFILAGGVAAFLNPEPLAPFVDAFLLGEAEVLLPGFFSLFETERPREETLRILARELPGCYAPSLYTPEYNTGGTLAGFHPNGGAPGKVTVARLKNLSGQPAASSLLTPDTTFSNTRLIEVGRGCPHGCRFCGAGFVYRPARFREPAALESSLEDSRAFADKAGLVGAAVSDLPCLPALASKAARLGLALSFSSFRVDAVTVPFARMLADLGVKTATLAPEAGSQRMRDIINKGVSEEQIMDAAERLVAAGVPNMKLYFMAGLPGETPEDTAALPRLVKRIKHQFLASSRTRGNMGKISVALSCFAPKAWTPFQWAAMDSLEELRAKLALVKRELAGTANVEVKTDVPRWAVVQALLARGDRRVADILLLVDRFEGNWSRALKESPVNADFFTRRVRGAEEVFPWDFLDQGVTKSYLWEEWQRAIAGKTTPPCRFGGCRACGACGQPAP
jgi:radical SAM superfamily enzyme YgiQ (UPF0313 family)